MSTIRGRRPRRLSPEERKSLTHGDFWIPDEEREVYRRALQALNEAEVPYVVAGAYAIYEHTGIYRQTKDLDLFVEPTAVIPAARALRGAGFTMRLEDLHWLAKAVSGERFVDLIYGMGNGVAVIDDQWLMHSRPGVLAAQPVRIAPAEELIWHRLFIGERVQVSGVLASQQEVASRSTPSQQDKATGTAGTPTVQTQTRVDMRTLRVNSLNPQGAKCETR